MLLLLLACLLPHLASRALLGRSGWPKRFLAAAAWICGAQVRVVGAPIAQRTLLVCNHVTWLDILVLGGATGCAFVSKDRLGHPLIHWLADQNATLYIRRDQRRDALSQADSITARLQGPQPLALFPEGTTGPGTQLLPFRSTLFSAVAPAPPEVSVRPVAIDYGEAAPDLGWHDGESGKVNALRTIGRTRAIPTTVRLLDTLPPTADRKALSTMTRDAIEAALASSRARPGL